MTYKCGSVTYKCGYGCGMIRYRIGQLAIRRLEIQTERTARGRETRDETELHAGVITPVCVCTHRQIYQLIRERISAVHFTAKRPPLVGLFFSCTFSPS